MSAALEAVALTDAADAQRIADSGAAFDANLAWEFDRALMLERSERDALLAFLESL